MVDTSAAKTKFRPGERLDYAGIRVVLDGRDVAGECSYEPASGTVFPADPKNVAVTVTHPSGAQSSFELHRKRSPLPILVGILCAACIAAVVFVVTRPPEVEPFPEGDTGSYLIPKGNMTDEEAQQLVNEMAEKSRITVSLAPEMTLKEDGSLRVNLIVPEDNNGLSERVEVVQDGEVVYRSGVVEPGSQLEWGTDSSAHAGDATATVYAIQDDADFGNPVSVEVTVVAEQ